ncbi:hypothetical protein KFK09_001385 [Dendrobium nobile]|uniref:Uncharacterized protein n=1 Tax=Dendrobium nobile TaxID=94219 RepID=A0A8T3CAR2_DENNO|nr:hypothetical protein KFK09_001385 [Dendrobium nobile]
MPELPRSQAPGSLYAFLPQLWRARSGQENCRRLPNNKGRLLLSSFFVSGDLEASWKLLEISKQQKKIPKSPKQRFGAFKAPWTAAASSGAAWTATLELESELGATLELGADLGQQLGQKFGALGQTGRGARSCMLGFSNMTVIASKSML